MDEQLKSRFKKVLEHYAGVIKERDDALIREKTAREQFEASFRTVVDRVILPAAEQVKELVTPKNWICRATKADNALSTKIEIYQGNMKAATGEGRMSKYRPPQEATTYKFTWRAKAQEVHNKLSRTSRK